MWNNNVSWPHVVYPGIHSLSLKSNHAIHHINRLKEKKLNHKIISVDEKKAHNKIQHLFRRELTP